jgi:hypothetical protein
MKKLFTITLLLVVAFAFSQKKEKVKGSKIVIMQQKEIPDFTAIEVEDNLEIFLVKGKECGLELEADDNVIEFIDYKVVSNSLRLSTTRDISSFKKLSVRITYNDNLVMVISKDETNVTALSDVDVPSITFKSYHYSKIHINSRVPDFTLMANDKSKSELNLHSEKVTIDVSKGSTVKALITAKELKFDMYQKSDATIEGDVNELKLRLDNDAEFNGSKLTASSIKLISEGNADAVIYAKNNVTIEAAGKSEIQLYGEPKIELKRFTDSAVLMKKALTK